MLGFRILETTPTLYSMPIIRGIWCNVQLWLLLPHQRHCHKTIADLRKYIVISLKNTFCQFNVIFKSWDLFKRDTLAGVGQQ